MDLNYVENLRTAADKLLKKTSDDMQEECGEAQKQLDELLDFSRVEINCMFEEQQEEILTRQRREKEKLEAANQARREQLEASLEEESRRVEDGHEREMYFLDTDYTDLMMQVEEVRATWPQNGNFQVIYSDLEAQNKELREELDCAEMHVQERKALLQEEKEKLRKEKERNEDLLEDNANLEHRVSLLNHVVANLKAEHLREKERWDAEKKKMLQREQELIQASQKSTGDLDQKINKKGKRKTFWSRLRALFRKN